MESLTLEERSPNDSKSSTEQMLLQLEDVFSFPTADSSTFPESHCREFTQLTRHIPQGKRFHNALISKKLLKCSVSLGKMSLIPLNRTWLGWLSDSTRINHFNETCLIHNVFLCLSLWRRDRVCDVCTWSQTGTDGWEHHAVTFWEGICTAHRSHPHLETAGEEDLARLAFPWHQPLTRVVSVAAATRQLDGAGDGRNTGQTEGCELCVWEGQMVGGSQSAGLSSWGKH